MMSTMEAYYLLNLKAYRKYCGGLMISPSLASKVALEKNTDGMYLQDVLYTNQKLMSTQQPWLYRDRTGVDYLTIDLMS